MNHKEEKFEQLQHFYALWREENAMYDDWAREQGLSSNSALILYALYEAKENCTQKSISQMWSIPKQTVNTILKEFSANGYIELLPFICKQLAILFKSVDLPEPLFT